ncbi:MAG: DUF6152 family protein [Woeseiaceae bacterium]
MRRFFLVALVVLAPAITWSHHSRSNFNLDEVLEFHGVITEYSWRNPHTFATLAIVNDAGESTELLLELNSVSVLTRQGWTRDTLKVGDEVTVFASPDNNPNKNLYYSNYFVLPDGEIIASAPGTAPNSAPRVRRQQPDRTAKSDDFSGMWRVEGGRFGERGRDRSGGNGEQNPNAMSLGGQTQAVGLPVTELGRAELDAWNVADNPWFRCVSKTPPWLFSGVGAHKFIRDDSEQIIIRHEILDVERIVYLGDREHPADVEPSHLGHSVGWFEDATLVVDTASFTPAQWGIGNGLSSSDEKHLVERFTLLDGGSRMNYEYTITDPTYLTEPVSLSQTMSLDPAYPWQDEYGCDPEASSRHLVD